MQALDNLTAQNPLLDFSGLPRFGDIKVEHITQAIEALLKNAESVFAQVVGVEVPATWDAVVKPLDDANELLGRAWGIVGHLHSVADTPELREAYNENLPKLTEFWTRVGQDERLYAKYKAIANASDFQACSPERKRVLENALRDFRLGGAELSDAAKERFSEIQEKMAALTAKFSENVLDATNDFVYLTADLESLQGLPEDAILAAREAAERDGKSGYKFTLQFPSYFPVLQYADNQVLRKTLYDASAKRASEFGKAEWDNGPLILEILKLREEESKLLGYRHFADVSLVPKMAESPEEVTQFLRDLAKRARPYAERDLQEIRDFAKNKLGMTHVEPWDMTYVSEKLRQDRYAFSDNELRQYFPEPTVLNGLFELTQTLFEVEIRQEDAPKWHEDVRFFTVYKNGAAMAHFYLDPYSRDQKRGGAWMDDARGRKPTPEGLQTPVAYLTCNFPRPVGGKPATLTHDDVLTLFHEFGHGLHHMLTRINEPSVAGISGVEWDAVELPSQFMENFGWEWGVLSRMTAHAETGEALPVALFEKMVAAKNFQSGLQMLRQIEFSLFDMRLHSDFQANGSQTVLELLETVREEVSVIRPPAYHRFPNSFTHIFAGGYSAGYYSYKWAEVLSADAYAQFEETGVLNPTTGKQFLDEILSVGGSRPAAQSFKAFRGRAPSLDALLRHSGMDEASESAVPA
jgi:oligopeptidase A